MDYLQYLKKDALEILMDERFKPYYKWITFNTRIKSNRRTKGKRVLNLIINGLPSILITYFFLSGIELSEVLNLIINGLPSILYDTGA